MKRITVITVLVLSLLLAGCSAGDFHSHKWVDANYQEPMKCSVCGETIGEKLEADFDAKKIEPAFKEGEPAEYRSITAEGQLDTAGTATITGTQVFKEDETHQAVDGYQWTIVNMVLSFSDEVSRKNGFDYNYLISDYYDIEGFTHSFIYDEAVGYNTFKVSWYGKDYDQCRVLVKTVSSEWEKSAEGYTKTVELTWNLLLPEGYDGTVIGVRNSKIDIGESHYLYQYYNAEDFLLYRIGGSNEKNAG